METTTKSTGFTDLVSAHIGLFFQNLFFTSRYVPSSDVKAFQMDIFCFKNSTNKMPDKMMLRKYLYL